MLATLPDATASQAAPVADCPRCKGAGYVSADVRVGHPDFGVLIACTCKLRQQQERQAAADGRRQALLLGRLRTELGSLAACTFANFDARWPGDDHAACRSLQRALAEVQTYAAHPADWLYLWGDHGSGKSHMAAAVANQIGDRYAASYGSVPRLLRFIQAGFNRSSADNADARIQALCEAELLILDDLGKEHLKASEGGGPGWAEATLFDLLDYRSHHELLTIITSNDPYDAHPPALASRIAGQSLLIEVRAGDYRQKHLPKKTT